MTLPQHGSALTAQRYNASSPLDGARSTAGSDFARLLLLAQRRFSVLVSQVAEGQSEATVRTLVLAEAARTVNGDILLLDALNASPVIAAFGEQDWAPEVVARLSECTRPATVLNDHLVVLQVPGTNEHLAVRSRSPFSNLDLFLLEPLLDVLALLRYAETFRALDVFSRSC